MAQSSVTTIPIADQNRPAAQVKIEQEEELYNKLYPKIADDFVHKEDFVQYLERLKADLQLQNAAIAQSFKAVQAALVKIDLALSLHTHISAAPGSAVSPSGTFTSPSVAYAGASSTSTSSDVLAQSKVDNFAISGFDGSIEKRKRSVTNLKPPFTLDS